MPCPDGVLLATRIWRPRGEGPWPVLLMRQPYGRAIASTVTYAHPRWYAERGFLVAVQDVRGRGGSQGQFAGFAQEAIDGATAVRWCRVLEGSSGRVGTYGFSYQGLSQLLLEAEPSPGSGTPVSDPAADPLPDCLAPAMCGLDERRHWASEGGAHWWSLGLGWALQLAAQGCQRRGDAEGWREIRRSLESGAYLHQGLDLLRRHDPAGMGLDWLQRDPRHPEGWRIHPVSDALLRRPLLLIGGWHDPHLTGVLDLVERAHAAGGQPALCIGAWSHLDWRGGIDALQLAFFRRHLWLEAPGAADAPPSVPLASGAAPRPDCSAATGVPFPLLPGDIALQCPRSGRWSATNARALDGLASGCGEPHSPFHWRLCSDGLAAIRSEEGQLLPVSIPSADAPSPWSEATVGPQESVGQGLTLVQDPWRPVPSRGGHLGPDPGLCDRTDLDHRSDVACFQTTPLEEPITLTGRPLLEIAAAADQPGFDLWATLSVVRPDGTVLQLCSGVRRLLGDEALELRPRLLRLQPLRLVLAAGERLRLSLAGSAWPAIAVNPGDGAVPMGGSDVDHRVICIALELRRAHLWFAPLIGAN